MTSAGFVGNLKDGLSQPAGLEIRGLDRELISLWNGQTRGQDTITVVLCRSVNCTNPLCIVGNLRRSKAKIKPVLPLSVSFFNNFLFEQHFSRLSSWS